MFKIAQFTDRYQTMSRALNKGAQDGSNNVPPFDERNLSPTELEIVQLAQDDINKYASKLKIENDLTWENLRVWRSDLSEDFAETIDTFKGRIEFRLNEVERDLLRLYENVLARRQEYRYFKTVNGLNRDADLPASSAVSISLLLLIVVGDGALNAFFFKDTNPLALVGGFLLAGAISLVNTASGFLAGLVPWRYLQHRNRLHLIWAFPMLSVMLLFIAVFNLGVGHYRDLLSAHKDVDAGEVINILFVSAFSLQSLKSVLLVAIGVGIAMLASYKGYTYLDTYPGFGKYFRRKEKANDLFEARLRVIEEEISNIAVSFLKLAKSEYKKSSKLLHGCSGAIDGAITRNRETEEAFVGISEACNAALRTYRDANLQVRNLDRYPVPHYFSKLISLSVPNKDSGAFSFEQAKVEFSQIAEKNKADYEMLCHALPAEVRTVLSEAALNARLDRVRLAAERARRERDE